MPVTANQLARLDSLSADAQDRYAQTLQRVQNWIKQASLKVADMADQSQTLAALTLASAVMTKPVDVRVLEQVQALEANQETNLLSTITTEEHQSILDKMKAVVQQPAGHLGRQEELYLEQQLTDMLGFEVAAELEGNRLNHTIGVMGGEQHLKRFPTDTLDQHAAYQESGIAPNRGAFGWFTEQGQLTDTAIEREQYYFAVQTLYLPNWNTDHPRLKEWYKFRKMIVINPNEEVAVVGVVGDAGPALWVQKQFGGSPEVIREGKIWSKSTRGRVLLLFVNDPEDKIPLGPVSLKLSDLEKIASR